MGLSWGIGEGVGMLGGWLGGPADVPDPGSILSNAEMAENAIESREQALRLEPNIRRARAGMYGAASQSWETSEQQQALADALARGGTSEAELQMRRGLRAGQMQAIALAQSQRGNRLSAQRVAGRSAATLGQHGAGQLEVLRAQEAIARQEQRARLLGSMRQGDLSTGGIYGQTGAAALTERTQEAGREQAYLGFGQQDLALQQQAAQRRQEAAEGQRRAYVAAGSTALSSLIDDDDEDSDRRGKRDIRAGDSDANDFMNALDAYMFRYRDESRNEPRRLGVMAQDLEESDIGREMVHETPRGKVVDTKRATMAALAALASLHDRVKRLEGRQ
jgi:hypothetical protein